MNADKHTHLNRLPITLHLHAFPVICLSVGILTFAGGLKDVQVDAGQLDIFAPCTGSGSFNAGSCSFDWSAILGE